MSEPRYRDPFAELQAALDVEPSPDFEARTRARLASARPRRSMALWLVPAVATAALVVIAVVAPWHSEPEFTASVETTLGAPEVATYVPASAPAPVAPRRPSTTARAAPSNAEGRTPPHLVVPPDLEMVTNQPEILRRLWASPNRWEVAESEPATEPQAATPDGTPPPEMIVPPIIVAPIIVDPMTVVRGGVRPPLPRHAVAPDATGSQ